MAAPGPKTQAVNERNFDYTADPATGLSAFYDKSKFTMEPIPEADLNFGKGVKAKAYRIQRFEIKASADGVSTREPAGTPILHIIAHAPSGSGAGDPPKREKFFKGLKKTVGAFLNSHPGYEDVVYSMDANISSRIPVDKKKTNELKDFKLNEGVIDQDPKKRKEGITTLFDDLIPDSCQVEVCATGTAIIKKTRAGDGGDNQQLGKALVTDPGVKAYCIHTKRIKNDVVDKLAARTESVKKALANIIAPIAVLTFGKDKTHGSDHSETSRVEVQGLGFVARPLINPFGSRGFNDPKDYYKDPKPEHAEIRVKATHKFLDFVMAELKAAGVKNGKIDKDTTKSIDEMDNTQSVADRANFIADVENAIIEDETILKRIIKNWAESGDFKAWNELFWDDKKKFTDEADILKCVKRIHEKNYKVAAPKGDKLEEPSKEGISLVFGTNPGEITYSLKTLGEDVVVNGKVNFTVQNTKKFSPEEASQLRNLIINDAKRILKTQEENPNPSLATFVFQNMTDDIISGKVACKEGELYLDKQPKDAGQHKIKYGVMIGTVKYTGDVEVTLVGGEADDVYAKVITSAVEADLAKKKRVIVNGKDIGNQPFEHMDCQPFSGFPAEFGGVHPRLLQMEHCAELVTAAPAGQSVDVVMVTENSDFSNVVDEPDNKDGALAKKLGYVEYFARQMKEVCSAMTQGRKPVLEEVPKEKRKAAEQAKPAAAAVPVNQQPAAGPKPFDTSYSMRGDGRKEDVGGEWRHAITKKPVVDSSGSSSSSPGSNAAPRSVDSRRMTPEELAAHPRIPVDPPEAQPVVTPKAKVKSKFPRGAVAAFAVAGLLVGAGVAIAAMGLVWPVAIVAVATAVVFGGVKAIQAKRTQGVEAASTAMDTFPETAEQGRPSQSAAEIACRPSTGATAAPRSVPTGADASSRGQGRRPYQ